MSRGCGAGRLLCLVAWGAGAVGCGASEPAVEADPGSGRAPAHGAGGEPVTEPAIAPRPYTVEELREGCPVGRWSLYAETDAAGQTSYQRTTFVAGPEGLATFEVTPTDASGQPLTEAPRRVTARWEELWEHASYPAERTTITQESIEVPAGAFQTRLYTVQQPDGSVVRAWFAPTLPGPPVRQAHVGPDGVERSSSTLLAVHDPRARGDAE